jgi:hypothetical protein
MKRSIGYYLIQGFSDTKWAFKFIPLSQRLLLLIYGFVAFFGKLFFFSRPFFTLAETNLVTLMNKRKPFTVWQMFDQVTNREQYKRLMVSYFVLDLFILFFLFILVLVPILIWLYLIPLLYDYEVMVGLYNVLIMYFNVLGIVGLLFSFSYYRPLAFVSMHNPQYGSGSIITSTHQLLIRKNIVSLFSLNFVYYLCLYFLGLLITIQASTVVFGSLVMRFGFEGFLSSLIFSIVFIILIFILLLWFIPLTYVFLIATQYHYLNDSLKHSETLIDQRIRESFIVNDPLPISSETEIKVELDKNIDSESKSKVGVKTKRKSV